MGINSSRADSIPKRKMYDRRSISTENCHRSYKLYVGFFDLEKAFNMVSKPLLLLSLIKMGLGSTMLHAIKAMYASTKCVIKSGNKLSNIFSTYSDIKQGAPSSVILFIIFMDELIDIMHEKCTRENIIGTLHILLHADDTVILSTDRSLFIKKV